ncbi:MAG: AAA family ATPase [Lachnospiraceae bacterium]|nr:AAA family ATPase [Lachnospiraceae bacterium]
MLLKKCYISNFGKLQDFTYEFKGGLNVICEENGWGKSTFAAFIRAMLYGMPQAGSRTKLEDAERRKYKPWQGGELGGYLVFEANGKEYKAERTFGAKEAEDTFRLIDLSTNLESMDFSAELGKELFGLDKEAYSRSTYLPQNKISDGGMNDSIGKKLGRMAEGDEESGNFDKAYGKLDELRKKYIPDRQKDEKGYVAELNRRISDTERRLENCSRKEENAKPWREKERTAAEQKKACHEALQECRVKLEAAAGYEASVAKKKHYGELCLREERLKQQKEGMESLFRAGVPEGDEIRQCLREAEEAAALSGELRSYRLSEAEQKALDGLQSEFSAEAPEGLYRQATEREEKERKNGKRFVRYGILFVLLAVILVIGAALSKKRPTTAATEQTVQNEAEVGSTTTGEAEAAPSYATLLFGIFAGIAAAGGICLVVAGLGKKKKEEQVREELYRLTERIREYERLSEQNERYCRCLERKNALLGTSEALLHRYHMETEDMTGALYVLENRRRDFLRFSEELAEAVKKREQFERENSPEAFLAPVQPAESYAELQQTERDIVRRIALLEEEEKDCRDRAAAFEEEAEDYGELAEALEELKEKLAAKKREHTFITETMKCLQTAKEQFSSRYMRELQKSFGEYVSMLGGDGLEKSTGGRFGGVETDINLQVQVSAYGKGKELGYFSTGMRDLIGLCMRFALVDALFEEEEPFLVLDDPFVNFDEDKLERALEFLRKTGEKYQILYLVCHSSRA